MKLERTFEAQVDEITGLARAKAFFQQSGYDSDASQPSPGYRRGSMLGSLLSFSPRHWKVNATVRFTPVSDHNRVDVILDVNTTGQLITPWERSFWNSELERLETSIRTGQADVTTTANLARPSQSQILFAYFVILGLAAACAYGANALFGSPVLTIGPLAALFIGISLVIGWAKSKNK